MRWKILPGLLGLAAAMLALADDVSACGRRRASCAPPVVIPCETGFAPFVIVDGGTGRTDGKKDGKPDDKKKRKPTRLKAFFIIDDHDETLKKGVQDNDERLTTVLKAHLGDRLDGPTVLTGDALRGLKTEQLLKRLEDLSIDPEADGVLFYYAGHGGYDEKADDQVFEVNGEKESFLHRKDVVARLKAKKPRLLVVLSDACAGKKTYVPVERKQAKIDIDPAAKAFARLFLDYDGEYVANAAQKGTLAWYQAKTGGLYTFALCKEAAQGEDTVKDRALTWAAYEKSVTERTGALFKDMLKDAGDEAPPSLKEQAEKSGPQKPETFVNDTRLIPAEGGGSAGGEARAGPLRTTLTVHTPPDARLFIDGAATTPQGEERRFTTEVWPGQAFDYELRVAVERGGRTLTVRRTVSVQAGARVEADLRAEVEAATANAEREAAAGRFARKEE
jgi:uncharacterized protein (TIGR03000 family)